MRGATFLLISCVAAIGCNKAGSPPPSEPSTRPVPKESLPREVKSPGSKPITSTTSGLTPLPKLPISGIFRPIPQRSTEELLEEVQHFSTKDHLPLLAELATRPKDKALIVPKMGLLQTDGRYLVRVAAANVAVAIDADHVGKHATRVSSAVDRKTQFAVYGPIVEDSPDLRKIQKLSVPLLIRVLEKELAEAKLHEQTLGALTVLGTFPKEVGKPAVEVVQKVAKTPMHPNGLFATQTLKKWGIE